LGATLSPGSFHIKGLVGQTTAADVAGGVRTLQGPSGLKAAGLGVTFTQSAARTREGFINLLRQ